MFSRRMGIVCLVVNMFQIPYLCPYHFTNALSLQHENGVTSKDELVAPEGWAWTSEWAVDTNRAVDEDGNRLLYLLVTAVLYNVLNVGQHLTFCCGIDGLQRDERSSLSTTSSFRV